MGQHGVCLGIKIVPWRSWEKGEEAIKEEIKKFLCAKTAGNQPIQGINLSPLGKLWFNVFHFCFVPRSKGINKMNAHEIKFLYHVLLGHEINLPFLIFSNIAYTAQRLREKGKVEGLLMPYSMWLSVLLKEKRAPHYPLYFKPYSVMTLSTLHHKVHAFKKTVSKLDKGKQKVREGSSDEANISGFDELFERFDQALIEKMEILETRVVSQVKKMEESILAKVMASVQGSSGGAAGSGKDPKMVEAIESLASQVGSVQTTLEAGKQSLAAGLDKAATQTDAVKVIADCNRRSMADIEQFGQLLVHRLQDTTGRVLASSNTPQHRHSDILARLEAIQSKTDQSFDLLETINRKLN